MTPEQQELAEKEWFQIALKTYFWTGSALAVALCVSTACLFATKYYYDQSLANHRIAKTELQAIQDRVETDVYQHGRDHREAVQLYREVRDMWLKFDKAMKEIDDGRK